LFVLVVLGTVVGVLVVTSGVLVARQDLYMRASTALDLTQDTRVLLQGLDIGRIRQVNAVVDSATGGLSFVARLSILERYPDGAPVALPRGTRAVIEQINPIAPPVVQLLVPDGTPPGGYLGPEDTLISERRTTTMDALGRVASDLSQELSRTLEATRELARRGERTALEAHRLIVTSAPVVTQALERLSGSLDRAERVLAQIEPRIVPLNDSVLAALADARAILRQLDRAATNAEAMTAESRPAIAELIQHLHQSAAMLEHFTEQVSRRPTRLITGVKPPMDTVPSPR
jgi:ABC-type transporter Mla subunit MlaD